MLSTRDANAVKGREVALIDALDALGAKKLGEQEFKELKQNRSTGKRTVALSFFCVLIC